MSHLKRSLILSLFFRLSSAFVAFISTRILIQSMGVDGYGSWAALFSLVSWVIVFDFGLGNSLKNYIATNNHTDRYPAIVAGIFQIFILVSALLFIIFLVFKDILQIVIQYPKESLILYSFIFVYFPLMVGTFVLQGLRRVPIVVGIGFCQQLGWLVVICFLSKGNITLIDVVLWSVVTTCISYFCIFIVAMSSISCGTQHIFNINNLNIAYKLLPSGLKFVALQISSIALFSMGTYYAYMFLPISYVATYDVVNKVGQFIIMGFNILISVYWVEIANDIGKRDVVALRKKFQQLKVWASACTFFVFIFMGTFMGPLLNWYSGGLLEYTLKDLIFFALLWSSHIFILSAAVFLNAGEKLDGQIVVGVCAIAILFFTLHLFVDAWESVGAIPLAITVAVTPILIYVYFKTRIFLSDLVLLDEKSQ